MSVSDYKVTTIGPRYEHSLSYCIAQFGSFPKNSSPFTLSNMHIAGCYEWGWAPVLFVRLDCLASATTMRTGSIVHVLTDSFCSRQLNNLQAREYKQPRRERLWSFWHNLKAARAELHIKCRVEPIEKGWQDGWLSYSYLTLLPSRGMTIAAVCQAQCLAFAFWRFDNIQCWHHCQFFSILKSWSWNFGNHRNNVLQVRNGWHFELPIWHLPTLLLVSFDFWFSIWLKQTNKQTQI